ncbi:MAG: ThuA domain-containing protein [Candidatus Eisenbacteria sp.]|nr:ThuA domain-containing protein [Candidatus Eisenbacteria bacterium]
MRSSSNRRSCQSNPGSKLLLLPSSPLLRHLALATTILFSAVIVAGCLVSSDPAEDVGPGGVDGVLEADLNKAEWYQYRIDQYESFRELLFEDYIVDGVNDGGARARQAGENVEDLYRPYSLGIETQELTRLLATVADLYSRTTFFSSLLQGVQGGHTLIQVITSQANEINQSFVSYGLLAGTTQLHIRCRSGSSIAACEVFDLLTELQSEIEDEQRTYNRAHDYHLRHRDHYDDDPARREGIEDRIAGYLREVEYQASNLLARISDAQAMLESYEANMHSEPAKRYVRETWTVFQQWLTKDYQFIANLWAVYQPYQRNGQFVELAERLWGHGDAIQVWVWSNRALAGALNAHPGIEAITVSNLDLLYYSTGVDVIILAFITQEHEHVDIPWALETHLREYVLAGGNLIGIHDVLWRGWRPSDEYLLTEVFGSSGSRHPTGRTLSFAMSNASHPICQGVSPSFSIRDESWPLEWLAGDADVLITESWPGHSQAAAWTRDLNGGAAGGRVFCFRPGHYSATILHTEVRKLLTNAALWCGGKL